jgi:hypothetical protein
MTVIAMGSLASHGRRHGGMTGKNLAPYCQMEVGNEMKDFRARRPSGMLRFVLDRLCLYELPCSLSLRSRACTHKSPSRVRFRANRTLSRLRRMIESGPQKSLDPKRDMYRPVRLHSESDCFERGLVGRTRSLRRSYYFLTSEHLLSLSGWATSSAGMRRRTL